MTLITYMQRVEQWERTCPTCGVITKRHSVDGGLNSLYYGECGHSWKCGPCGPFAKDGKEATIDPEFQKWHQSEAARLDKLARLDELEREFNKTDQIVARKWGEEGRSIDGDLEWLIALARKALKP